MASGARLIPPSPKPTGAPVTPAIRAVRVKVAKAAASPKFQRVIAQIQQGSRRVATHPPAQRKAAEAQAAVKGPDNQKEAGARVDQIDDIKDAKSEKPNKSGFLELLRGEIDKVMPHTNEDATKFMQGGEGDQVKAAVGSNVKDQKEKAVGPTEKATNAEPKTAGVPEKEVTPLPSDPAAVPPGVDAKQAVPDPRPESGVQKVAKDTSDSADKQMKDAELTDTQLTKANDPRFSGVLTARDKVKTTAAAGSVAYRAGETKMLTQANGTAAGIAGQGAHRLAGTRNATNAKTKSAQQLAKEKDEADLRIFTNDITGIFNATKTKVDGKLATLETDAMSMFDRGIDAALAHMKSGCEQEIDDFKDDRYSGIIGKGKWLVDKFRDTLPQIKAIIARWRSTFTVEMDRVAVNVAALVDGRLAEAKGIVDDGQAQVKARAAQLSPHLRAKGAEAAQALTSKFDELRQSIDDKAQDLAEKLAQKYKDASEKADSLAKEIDDANKGALKALADKIGEIIKILADFADRVVSLFKKAAGVLKKIIGDPIGFLGNLLSAIKQGISQFISNIWTHIKRGFLTWLFGELTKGGIEIPSELTLPAILKLVLGVLGLTWAQIRPRVVKKIGERAVAVLEKVVEMLTKLFTGGPEALWEEMKAFVGDLKSMVIDAILDWVITKVITSAITKVASMFNPAGAIIQAIMMVYNVGSWLVANIGKILDFIESVISSVDRIANGDVGGAASYIEESLAKMIPILIGFLASMLGLGGLGEKVKSFITKVQGTVGKAVDFVIDKTVAFAKKAIGAVKDVGQAVAGAARAGVAGVANWWTARKAFRATDKTSHTLFFQGEGANAVLSVATTPTPVNGFLASIMSAARSSADPTVASNHRAAMALARQIDVLRRTVESGPNPRQPADIDALNGKLNQMADLLPPLLPLLNPAAPATAAGPVSVQVKVNELIKVVRANRVAVVSAIAAGMVQYRFINPGGRLVTAEGILDTTFAKDFGTAYLKYVEDPRELYLGDTPSQTDQVGAQVKQRMQAEGKLRNGANGEKEILYSRDGKWYPVSACDMGHVIDGVTWWNSNGRLTGAQSATVRQFMTSPINYELEPSGPNRSRGARIGRQYLPPAV